MKAYICGITIAYTAKRNKEKWRQHNTLQEEIKKLETQLQIKPQNNQIKKEMILAKHKLNILDKEENARNLKFVKQNFFEYANKPWRWLSYKLKRERERKDNTAVAG
uniref:Uncharacterized protein n=1 Tax=Micrurus paraensis TaxID=1970185 RepID=A0A2D4K4L4_9SAUR